MDRKTWQCEHLMINRHVPNNCTYGDAPFLLMAAGAVTWGCGCWGRRSTRSFSAQFFLRFHDWILKLGLLIDVAEQKDAKT